MMDSYTERQQAALTHIGIQFRKWRRAADMSSVELSAASGVDGSTILRLERGETNVGVATVAKLLDALGVDANEIFPKPAVRHRLRRYEVTKSERGGDWLVVAIEGQRRWCAAVRDTKLDAEAAAHQLRKAHVDEVPT